MVESANLLKRTEMDSKVAELRAALSARDEELRQKELMMREVNHRVANSLQLASSILRMQAFQETDEHTRNQLEKAGLRISSIQHVHDRLYRSGDMRSVEFAQYLRDLCNDLSTSVLQEDGGQRFHVAVSCDRVRLPTDYVSKLGLVVNEFVTNAFKHGYNGGQDCLIQVNGRIDGEKLALTVSDGGPGLPQDFDITRIKGLGMRLVRFVAGSLGGEAGARNGEAKGAEFFVLLPLPATPTD